MAVATAAQPSFGQKHWVPIVAGTLGGSGLILILGCLFYCFLWRRRRRSSGVLVSALPGEHRLAEEDCIRVEHTLGDGHFDAGRISLPHRVYGSSYRNYSEQIEHEDYAELACETWPWTMTAEDGFLSSPNGFETIAREETPLADWGLPSLLSVQDSVPRQSLQHEVLPPDPAYGFPFDIDLEVGNPGERDSNVDFSDLGALPFANVDLETYFDIDCENSDASTVPTNLVLGPSREKNSPAGCNNPGPSNQLETTSALPSTSSASINPPPNDERLGPLRTIPLPSSTPLPLQATQKPDSLPLPPAPNLRCPHCPRKFTSRIRLE